MYICIFYMFVLVSLRILKIFRTAILWTPVASYFHYYVMQQFFINQKCFYLYLFQWRHWEKTSDCLLLNISTGSSTVSSYLCKHKLHLLQLGLFYLFYLSIFILQDFRGWLFWCANFHYSVSNFISFMYFFWIKILFMICKKFLKCSFADSFIQFMFIFLCRHNLF